MSAQTVAPSSAATRQSAQPCVDDYAAATSAVTTELLRDWPDLPRTRVVEAAARARVHVRNSFASVAIDLPPVDEFRTLVSGLARQELELLSRKERR